MRLDADDMYNNGQEKIREGEKYKNLGDQLGLVMVIYAVVLFLLGIINTFKSTRTKLIITSGSSIALIYAVRQMTPGADAYPWLRMIFKH